MWRKIIFSNEIIANAIISLYNIKNPRLLINELLKESKKLKSSKIFDICKIILPISSTDKTILKYLNKCWFHLHTNKDLICAIIEKKKIDSASKINSEENLGTSSLLHNGNNKIVIFI